jgi:hypothetical protein
LAREPLKVGEFAPYLGLRGGPTWDGLAFTLTMKCFTEPYELEEHTHAHDYDILLCFIGGNPLYIKEFGAEVEIYLGEEHEKHVINTTTIVHIPKGLLHCPLIFKKVDKPVIFMNIGLTPNIQRTLGPPPRPMIPKYDTEKYKI